MLKTFQKFTGLLLASAFIAVTLFGLNMGMDMRGDGTMFGCMFDQSVTCPMNYQEHVNHWQQTFVATQTTQNTILALLTVLVLGGITLFSSSLFNQTTYSEDYIPPGIWKYRNMLAKLFDQILQALSSGILNPKLYNFSHAIR